MILQKKNFFFQDVGKLKGVGPQLSNILQQDEKIKDIVLNYHILKLIDQNYLN